MIRTDFQYKMTQLCRKKIWEVHVYIYPKLWIFSVSIFPKLFGCGIQSSHKDGGNVGLHVEKSTYLI